MCINHESDHSQKEKLVVSPAINQVVQSLSARLLRVGYFVPPSYGLLISPMRSARQKSRAAPRARPACHNWTLHNSPYPWDSAAVSIVFMGAAPARATPSPTSRRGSLYAPSQAPGDLNSDPLSPMSPPSL